MNRTHRRSSTITENWRESCTVTERITGCDHPGAHLLTYVGSNFVLCVSTQSHPLGHEMSHTLTAGEQLWYIIHAKQTHAEKTWGQPQTSDLRP